MDGNNSNNITTNRCKHNKSKITGDSLKISPLLVIFAVTVGGAYFGVLGMFLAVPIATVIKIILEDYIKNVNA